MSGNVILTFTDLSLPGNAGRTLTFQRVYNSQRANYPGIPQTSRWTFGFPGIVMRVKDDFDVKTQEELEGGGGLPTHIQHFTPQFVTADGGLRRTIYRKTPVGANAESQRWVTSAQFYVYDRAERKIYMPDGTICVYNEAGYLVGIWDQFGNTISLQYYDDADQAVDEPSPNGMRQITQALGNNESRTVTIELDAYAQPSRMLFDNRQWL